RSRQIGHDGYAPTGFCRHLSDAPDDFPVTLEVAVRKIQPRAVQSRTDETLQHLRRFRGRPEGGNNLGLVRRQGCRVHDANMVLPAPRRSVTACFTRSAIATSAS